MVYKIMEKVIKYFGHDVRRINHALKVFSFASLIAENELNDNLIKKKVYFSALLHDIGIKEAEKKYNSNSGKYQEIEGPPIAKKFLEELLIDKEIVDRVCYIIGNHHTYNKIDGIDFQILVESDFLVNIFEDGIDYNNIINIKNKFFKTKAGINLLESLYL